ncbi:hypothetical protein [Allorhodopirellula solitaria]|uniref:RHS Repeat protein n=1 Tax=Allorhodopirellula solitaria TaxID=2527987 RepID=A0A5C5X1I2_9BACT|nr:hypothetical protein [Allorhodopirellula solitaria]TWT56459.1 hypothetical protein CA85_42720 [Allorhodopirellula solitaria]
MRDNAGTGNSAHSNASSGGRPAGSSPSSSSLTSSRVVNVAAKTDFQQQIHDEKRNVTWAIDVCGLITLMIYDEVFGTILQQIDDANTSLLSGVPSGWSTPNRGGKHLIFDYEIDSRGRTTQQLGPVHTIDIGGVATVVRRADWTIYKDAEHATWTASGYATGIGPAYAYTLINPVNIQQRDARGNILEQIQVPRGSTSGRLQPTDTFSQASFTRWTSWQYTDGCLVSSMRNYHTIPASGAGASGPHYDLWTYSYDSQGRMIQQVSPSTSLQSTRRHCDDAEKPTG